MIRKISQIAVIIIILSICTPLSAENPIRPKLNFAPGASYLCSMEMNKQVKQTIDGEEQRMEQNLLLVWDYDILAKNDAGNYEISARYARIKSSQRFGMQKVEFDSDNMPDYIDPSMIGYKILVGSEITMEVTPEGKVKRLDGFQEIIDKIIDELNIPDSRQRNEIISGLQKQFGDEAMRQSFEQMTAFYPENPVDTGDSWHTDIAMDVGFPVIVESDYTMLSRKDGIADIDVLSIVRSNPNSEGIDMGLFSLSYDIEGDQKGLIKMDEVSGLPVKSDIRLKFSGTVEVSGAPDLEEKSWPISTEGQVIIAFDRQ